MKASAPPFWKTFARVTSSGVFIPEVDGLRFIAVAWVLCFHISGEYIKVMGSRFPGQTRHGLYNEVLGTWDFGVQLFFVISGFILSLPFAAHYWNGAPKPRLSRYYIRRVSRIEPPYIINLLIFSVLILLVKGPPVSQVLPHLLASLCYFHNAIYQDVSTVNFVTWSLEIEAQFYLVAPVLAMLFSWRFFSNRYSPLVLLTLVSAVLTFWLNRSFGVVHLTLVGQLPYFLAGFILAGWYTRNQESMARKSLAWDFVGLACWGCLQALLLVKGAVSALALPFVVTLGYVGIFRGRLLGMIFTRPLITTIGGMCYTIYLYHPFLKSALKHLVFPFQLTGIFWLNSAFQILALGSLIIAVCALLFLAFEKPFMYRDWPQTALSGLRRILTRLSLAQPKPELDGQLK
jgi:peptidoglycan/LPS O-acetylase OafA/YrhL